MASRALHAPRSAPLEVLLAAIPSLPRAVLARLTERLIDRLDELDPDPDAEAGGWNERPSQARWPRNRLLLIDTDAEMDDFDEDGHDREYVDDREPEPYDGGHLDQPLPYRTHLSA